MYIMSLASLAEYVTSNHTVSTILTPFKPLFRLARWFFMIPIRICSSAPVQQAFNDTMALHQLYIKNWYWVLMALSTFIIHSNIVGSPKTMRFQKLQIQYSLANSQSESDRWAEKWRMI